MVKSAFVDICMGRMVQVHVITDLFIVFLIFLVFFCCRDRYHNFYNVHSFPIECIIIIKKKPMSIFRIDYL